MSHEAREHAGIHEYLVDRNPLRFYGMLIFRPALLYSEPKKIDFHFLFCWPSVIQVKGNGVCLPCGGITARERRADDSYLSPLGDGRIKSRLEDGQVRPPRPHGSAVQLPGEERPRSIAAV